MATMPPMLEGLGLLLLAAGTVWWIRSLGEWAKAERAKKA